MSIEVWQFPRAASKDELCRVVEVARLTNKEKTCSSGKGNRAAGDPKLLSCRITGLRCEGVHVR